MLPSLELPSFLNLRIEPLSIKLLIFMKELLLFFKMGLYVLKRSFSSAGLSELLLKKLKGSFLDRFCFFFSIFRKFFLQFRRKSLCSSIKYLLLEIKWEVFKN